MFYYTLYSYRLGSLISNVFNCLPTTMFDILVHYPEAYTLLLVLYEDILFLLQVLHDRLMAEQTVETFELSFKPKVQATHYLDDVTRKLCKDTLEWFVPFSSTTSLFGNAGQSNCALVRLYRHRFARSGC